jgi:hypothetical protein
VSTAGGDEADEGGEANTGGEGNEGNVGGRRCEVAMALLEHLRNLLRRRIHLYDDRAIVTTENDDERNGDARKGGGATTHEGVLARARRTLRKRKSHYTLKCVTVTLCGAVPPYVEDLKRRGKRIDVTDRLYWTIIVG